MWGAFVTGFAEQASKEIEKTNKEISDRMIARMTDQIKKREAAEEIAETKRDAARKQADAIKALAGPNLTSTQIIGIIHSGEADTVIKKLRDRQVGPERLKQLFIPADPNAQADLEQYLSEIGKLTGQAPAKEEMERGAFGLPVRAGEAASANLLAAYGRGREEVFQTTLARPEGVAGTLDLSVLAEEKEEDTPTIKQLQGRLADQAVKNNMSVDDYIKKTDDGASLAARIAGRRLQGGDEEDKARTTDQIRKLVKERLDEQITPLEFKNIIFDPVIGDYKSTIPGNPEALEVQRLRRNVATEVFTDAGLLKGNKILDRNAADALSRYAVIDYATLTLKSWRPVAGATEGTAPVADGATPVPAKKYTPEQLKTATKKAILANPQNRAQLIKEYEDSTGLKFND